VIIGAYFTWADFIAEIKSISKEERTKVNKTIEQKYALLKNNSIGQIMNPDYASELIKRQSIEKLDTIILNEELKIQTSRRVEIFIMVMGTLIWAYGDLINKLMSLTKTCI